MRSANKEVWWGMLQYFGRSDCKIAMTSQLILGGPGCGKTEYLVSTALGWLNTGIPSHKIAFVSFTKAAVNEARARMQAAQPGEYPWFRTIHSLAFRQIGASRSSMFNRDQIKELAQITGEEFTGKQVDTDGPLPPEVTGDHLLHLEQLSRAMEKPLSETWRHYADGLDWYRLKRFVDAYRVYKQERSLIDFTDLLDKYVAQGEVVPVTHAIVDEAQDLNMLQWHTVNKAFSNALLTVAGDDDQCQPGDTRVLTTKGEKLLRELNSKTDKLISYCREDSAVYGYRSGGYSFEKAMHQYTGLIYSISVAGKKTDCTATHKWFVKWTKEAKKQKPFAVYLMKKDKNFRVGWCQIFNSEGCFRVCSRAREERADAVWILKICTDKMKAYEYENIVSAKYGIPMLPFHPGRGNYQITKKVIETVFNSVDSLSGGLRALREHGLYLEYPFVDRLKPNYSKYGTAIMEVIAANLLSGLMLAPLAAGKTCQWEKLELKTRAVKNIPVYGLSVKPYKTYIANGIITHNCIHSWAGAADEYFRALPYRQTVLSKSHRLPAAIHALSDRVISTVKNRYKKIFSPADREGKIYYANGLNDVPLEQGQWLVLARSRWLCYGLAKECRERGLLYSLHGRSSVVPEELELIEAYGGPDWHDKLVSIPLEHREYYLAARRKGERLRDKPRIRIETIHGAKGLEAPNVALLAEMPRRAQQAMEKEPDSEARVWYVGLTRASEALYVMGDGYAF